MLGYDKIAFSTKIHNIMTVGNDKNGKRMNMHNLALEKYRFPRTIQWLFCDRLYLWAILRYGDALRGRGKFHHAARLDFREFVILQNGRRAFAVLPVDLQHVRRKRLRLGRVRKELTIHNNSTLTKGEQFQRKGKQSYKIG